MLLLIVILFSILYLFQINRMTAALCMQRDIPEEKQSRVFTTINVLITILLICMYVEVLLAT